MPADDPVRAALVAQRTELLVKIRALRSQVAAIDKQIRDRDAAAGLARRLQNLTPAERELLDDLARTQNLDQMGLLDRDGTVRKKPR